MKSRYATQGSALILVMLTTLLLLMVVLTATMRLGLASRQNTADQKAVLSAQYTAESGIALARSRLRDIQKLIQSSNMTLPNSVFVADVDGWAKQFCGQGTVTNPWQSSTAAVAALGAGAQECVINVKGLTDQRYVVLANIIRNTAYTVLPSGDNAPTATSTTDQESLWWKNYLTNVSVGGLQYSLEPLKMYRKDSTYRFYIGLNQLKSAGVSGVATRTVDASRAVDGNWWFEISVPNPFDNALMLDLWSSSDGGLYNDVIKGNTFTNQWIRFLYSTNRARFMGDLRSAGCSQPPASTAPDGSDCAATYKTSGFYGAYTTFVSSGASDDAIKSRMQQQGATFAATSPTGEATVADFRANYMKLPLTANDQATAASSSGISIPLGVSNVEMVAGDSNGNPLTTYNASTSSWDESGGVYQYIRLTSYASNFTTVSKSMYDSYPAAKKRTNCTWSSCTYSVNLKTVAEYRYGADKLMSGRSISDTATGTPAAPAWSPLNRTFNGVIYSNQRVTVNGPKRIGGSTTNDVSRMPPALASFSQINLTGAQGMDLDTDLTVSDTPCGYDNTWPSGATQSGCPKSPSPSNVLALYAPTGDITMTTNTPNEATYHAAIMASAGTFNVASYDKRPVQGKRHVVGAVVEQHYGLNGQASISNGNINITSGYGDDFNQDIRLRNVDLIPSNPIVKVWKFRDAGVDAGTANQKNLDSFTWRQGRS